MTSYFVMDVKNYLRMNAELVLFLRIYCWLTKTNEKF